MQEKSLIKQNILKYLDFIGVSQYKFYQITGITRGILQQNNGMSEENTARFLDYFKEVNPEWLITGKEPMLKNQTTNDHSEEYKLIPLYDGVVTASMSKNELTPQTEPVEMVNAGDWFRDATAAMRVYGDSMHPHYQSGSIVTMREVVNKRLISYGQDYLIETSEYRVLKKIQKSDNPKCWLLCSTNLETYEAGELKGKLIHEPQDVLIDDVIRVYQILGSIKRNHSNKVIKI